MSGGGGRTINGTGYTDSVKTHHTEHIEFWVQGQDGREKHFKAGGNFIPIRDGQEVIVCYSVIKGRGKIVMTKNLTTGDYYRDKSIGPLVGGILLTIILSIVIFFWVLLSNKLTETSAILSVAAFLAAAVGGGFLTYINHKKHKELRNAEDEYIKSII